MKRNTVLMVLLCVIVCIPSVAGAADVSITEVMYDAPGTDTQHEWVEVYNNSGSTIDFSTWKFYEQETRHALAPMGSSAFSHGVYAIIAENPTMFASDFPDYTGLVFDSSFSLKNDGEVLALWDGQDTEHFSTTYEVSAGGSGDGNTISAVGGVWSAGSPSPGQSHQNTTEQDTEVSESFTNTTGSSSGKSKSSDFQSLDNEEERKSTREPGYYGELVTPKQLTMSVSGEFELLVTRVDQAGREIRSPKGYINWNFGDGDSLQAAVRDSVAHIYRQEGNYVVTAEYWTSTLGKEPTLSFMHTQHVVNPGLLITRGVDYVNIESQAPNPLDVSGWKISQGSNVFVFESGTYLPPGSKVPIYNEALGYIIDTRSAIIIHYPNNNLAYTAEVVAPKPPVVVVERKKTATENLEVVEVVSSEMVERERVVLAPEPGVAASVSGTSSLTQVMWVLGGIMMVLIGLVLFLLIKLEKNAKREDEDEGVPMRVVYEEES
jgi:hypothetical protein